MHIYICFLIDVSRSYRSVFSMGSTALEKVPLTKEIKDNSTRSLSVAMSRKRNSPLNNGVRGGDRSEGKGFEEVENEDEKEMMVGERTIFYLHGLSWVKFSNFIVNPSTKISIFLLC